VQYSKSCSSKDFVSVVVSLAATEAALKVCGVGVAMLPE